MDLNATDLTLIQRGDRLYSISRKYRYLPWHPTALFSHIMREAIVNLSNNPDVSAVSSAAVNAYLRAAMQPGLDLRGVDTYTLAQDYCATIRTVLEAISRQALMSLSRRKPVQLDSDITWHPLNYEDDSGTLHRWVFVDTITDDALYHYGRSWEVFADQAILSAPLYLHLISIGSTQRGRRVSPWCRIFASPAIPNVFKFKNKHGELKGDWKPIWYADSTRNKPTTWVDLMAAEDVLPSLMHTRLIHTPSDTVCDHFFAYDLPDLSQRISAAITSDPFTLPMCRTSCDTPYPCPHESTCYSTSPSISTLENSGLYSKLPTKVLR